MPKRRDTPHVQMPPPNLREVSFWVSREERQQLAQLAFENNVAVGEMGRAILKAYVERWPSVEKAVTPVLQRLTETVRLRK